MKTDPAWTARLRYRLDDFRATEVAARGEPWSLKIRSAGWRFERESAAAAFIEADQWIGAHPRVKVWLLDHSTGPEILCFGRVVGTECLIDPAVRELLSVLVRSGRKAAPAHLSASLEVFLRGFDGSGTYVERSFPVSVDGGSAVAVHPANQPGRDVAQEP
jgi:hypothetical protein